MYNEHHHHNYTSPASHCPPSPHSSPSFLLSEPSPQQPRGKHRLRSDSLLKGSGGPAWQPTRLTSSYCVLRAAEVLDDYYTSCLSWGQQHVALALREHVLLFHPRQPERGDRPVPSTAATSSSSSSSQQRHTTAATTTTTTFNSGERDGAGRHPSSVAITRSDDRALFLGFSDGTVELYRSDDGGALASEMRFEMPDGLAACDAWLSLPAPNRAYLGSGGPRAAARLAATTATAAAAAVVAEPHTPTTSSPRRSELDRVMGQLRGTVRTMAPTLSSITAMATSASHPSLVALTSSSKGLLLLDHRQRKPCSVFAYSPSHDNGNNIYTGSPVTSTNATAVAGGGGDGGSIQRTSSGGSSSGGAMSAYPTRGGARWWPPPGGAMRRPTASPHNDNNSSKMHTTATMGEGGVGIMPALRTDTGTLYDTSPMYASSTGSGGYSPAYLDVHLHREQEEAEEREVIDWFYHHGAGRATAAPTTVMEEDEEEEAYDERESTPRSDDEEEEKEEEEVDVYGAEREATYPYDEETHENDEEEQMVLRYLQQAANYLLSQDRLCSVSFNACGELVATGSSAGVVQVWSIHQNRQPLYSFTFRPYLAGGGSSALGRSSSSGSGSGSNFRIGYSRHPSPVSATTPRSQGSPHGANSSCSGGSARTETTVKALAFHPSLPYELAVGGGVGPAGVKIYDLSDGGGGGPEDKDALAESLPAYTQPHAAHAGGGRAPRCVAAGATQAAALQLVYAPDGGHLVSSHGPLRSAGTLDGGIISPLLGTLRPQDPPAPAPGGANANLPAGGANVGAGAGAGTAPGELWQSNSLLVWRRTGGGAGTQKVAAAAAGKSPYEVGCESPHTTGLQTLQPLYALPGHRARPLHIAVPYSSTLPTYTPSAPVGGSSTESSRREPRPLYFPQGVAGGVSGGGGGGGGTGSDGPAGVSSPYLGCVASVAGGGDDSTIRFWDIFQRRSAGRHAAQPSSPPYPTYASGYEKGYAETELR